MRWVFDELFAAAGTNFSDHVRLRPLDTLARHAWDENNRLDLFADERRSADAIGDFAGAAEAARYRDFLPRHQADLRYPRKAVPPRAAAQHDGLIGANGFRGLMRLPHLKPFSSMWSALAQYFHDPRLRQLFGRYATYCGSSPFKAPATLMLVAHVEREGVWSVDGGMHGLARALAGSAEALGAAIRYDEEAAEVLTSGGRACGVRLASGERIEADAVIINADVAAVAGGFFGINARRAAAATPARARSLSALTWSVVAQADGFPLRRHNVFFSRDYAAEFDDIFRRDRLPREPTVYVCAQDRDDATAGDPRRGKTSGSRQRASEWRPAFLRGSGGGTMRTADIRLAGAVRPADPPAAGNHGGDDTGRFQPAVSRDGRRAVRPQLARMDGLVSAAGSANQNSRALSGGGQHPSGTGRADGGAVGPLGGACLMEDLASICQSPRTAMPGGMSTR